MKKTIYLLLILLPLFSACTKSKHYKVEGRVEEGSMNGQKVVLFGISPSKGLVGLDSTFISENTFELKGKVDSAGWYVLMIQAGNTQPYYKDFYVGGTTSFNLKGGRLFLSGSEINDKYQEFEDRYIELSKNLVEINKQMEANPQNDSLKALFDMSYDQFVKAYGKLATSSIVENMDNPLGIHLFEAAVSSLSNEDVEVILAKATPEFLELPFVKMVKEQFTRLNKVQVGKKCPDLKMMNLKSRHVKLSEYLGKGNYVLIDFWASWCTPCMKDMPGVVALYNKYHKSGFEIVGVSLDEKPKLWKAAVEKNKMIWPQMTDIKGWNSQAIEVFCFSSIPHTVLVDPNGVIVANGLRGISLANKLKEIYKY